MKKEQLKRAIDASLKFQELMAGVFPTFIIGINNFIEESNNPAIGLTKDQSKNIMNGVLIVQLFSMWDTYFHKDVIGEDVIEKYFRPEEKERFYAFKHIRHVFAHNMNGDRRGNKGNDKMRHYEKLDNMMESDGAIEGLKLDEFRIDLSNSNAALDCRQFMQDMAMKLAAGRFSVGGAYGKIKVSGGGETEIM
ncbi:MAG: hypothetical protein AAF388_18660 [Bacteroidota bacterium]